MLPAMASMASAQTKVTWWHAMGGGELGELLEQITVDFNESPGRIPRGRALSSAAPTPRPMTGAIAAFRAGEQPHILQVFEVGTGTMNGRRRRDLPESHQLMEENDVEFDPSAYLDTVGRLLFRSGRQTCCPSPFNSSTPIMYYNKDIFEEAGLVTPETPPATWAEAEEAARAIVESGAAPCGFNHLLAELGHAGELSRPGTTFRWARWATALAASRPNSSSKQRACGGGLWDDLKSWQDEDLFRWGGPPVMAPMPFRPSMPANAASSSVLRPAALACLPIRSSMSVSASSPIMTTSRVPRRTPSSAAPRCGS